MKNKTFLSKALSFVLCLSLIAAIGLFAVACNNKTDNETPQTSSVTDTASETASSKPTDGYGSIAEDIGEGKTVFIFRVTDQNNDSQLFRVHTDEKNLGAVLQKLQLISGEQGQYGLYVKTVNGIEADYDKTKTYWALYINDEQSMTGVDQVEIKPDTEYTFKIEK